MSLAVGCGLLFAVAPAFGQGYPADQAAERMTVAEGLAVTLFASEPEVRQPIFCKCDDRGRLWTIQYLQYPNPAGLKRVQVDRFSRTVYDRKPEPPPRGPTGADRITILEDTDGDGRADRFRDFVTGLNLCTGVEFGYGGVFVIQAPYLLFYADRNRDDVPDGAPEVLLDGFGLEDAQSLANHLTWGPDGWLYGLNGSTTTCNIRGVEFQQGVWRYHPVTRAFELFCEGGGNVYGLTFDRQGRLFYSSNGGLFYHGIQGGYYEKNFGKHGPLHNLYAYGFLRNVEHQGQTGRPNTGATIYVGRSFPAAFRDAFLCGDFLTHTCSWWRVQPRGSTVAAELGGILLDSHDTWFGATDLCLGPDGAMYVCDFHDQRTAHPDPDAKWDTSNGRIYRIQATGAGKPAPIDLAARSTADLIELLRSPNGWMAQRARQLLGERRDRSSWPVLRDLALQRNDHDLALAGLWAAHGAGALDDDTAASLLEHPGEHVRAWTVRLLGDARRASSRLERKLADLAANDSSVVVRAQLAATAKRLPGSAALPVLTASLQRDMDAGDPHVPWLLWWGLESKAISERDHVLEWFVREETWKSGLARENAGRLVRRYAAEGTAAGYESCRRLWSAAPEDRREPLLAALHQGLTERSRGLPSVGSRGLFDALAPVAEESASRPARTFEPVAGKLRDMILAEWQTRPDDALRSRLALEAGLEEPYARLLGELRAETAEKLLLERLGLLKDHAREDCVPAVLALAGAGSSETVRIAALDVLQRFARDDVARQIVADYPRMAEAVQSRARDLLFSRPASTLAFLQLVEKKQIDPAKVPIDQLRRLSLFKNDDIDALVTKHWGKIQPGTPEEKLAEIRRITNDLRAGTGDFARGRELFRKHCSTCHKLHGTGTEIGPDLAGTVKGDLPSLLANVVDPGAVVRSNFLTYVVVTTGGVTLTGMIVDRDAASLTLVDAKNQRTRISRDQIDELTESSTSLMPEKLLEPLTPQELRDLFGFLRGGEAK